MLYLYWWEEHLEVGWNWGFTGVWAGCWTEPSPHYFVPFDLFEDQEPIAEADEEEDQEPIAEAPQAAQAPAAAEAAAKAKAAALAAARAVQSEEATLQGLHRGAVHVIRTGNCGLTLHKW